MTRFDRAFDYLMKLEGVLSDHPADPGGLTAYGITKRDHPKMFENGIPTKTQAKAFYQNGEYWTDEYELLASERIAFELFECGVLCGVNTAGKFMQRAYNLLVDGSANVLKVDGIIGPRSVTAFNFMCERYGNALYRTANCLQGQYFIEINNGFFLRGWMGKRLD